MKKNVFLLAVLVSIIPNSVQAQQVDSLRNDSIWKTEVLDSVVVRGSMVVRDLDKDVWTITDEMRQRTYDTYELLGKIPGFFYNRARSSLTYMGRDNIRFLVNGIEKEADYVGMLANKRFKKIEITQHPTGRYQDYDVVVNLITKTEWLGYEGYVRNFLRSSPSREINDANNYTFISFTSPKIDASADYYFKHNDELKNVRMTMTEQNLLRYKTLDGKESKEYSQTNTHYAWADADYKINKNHTLSFKYSYVLQDNNSNSDYQMEKYDIGQNLSQIVKRSNRDDVQKNIMP